MEHQIFITVFTTARSLPLSWATFIQSTPCHPNFLKSILISSPIPRLGIQSGPTFSGLANQILHPFSFSTNTCYMPHPSHPLLFYISCTSTFKVHLPANEMTVCVCVCVRACGVMRITAWWLGATGDNHTTIQLDGHKNTTNTLSI